MFGLPLKNPFGFSSGLEGLLYDALWLSYNPLHKEEAWDELVKIASTIPDPVEPPVYEEKN